VTQAELIASCPRSLRLDDTCVDQLAHHIVMLEQVFQHGDRFDLIHFHIDYLHFPLSRCHRRPHLTTLHGRLDIPDLQPIYRLFPDQAVVSISDAQRRPLPHANWLETVYHGLPKELYSFREEEGKYLAFLGRVSPEKRVDRAIRIAQRTGIPLKIAAKVDSRDEEYFKAAIKPLLRSAGPLVEFIGEIGAKQKEDFLQNARALLFPIDWPEPFGLVMIEAMACGTPVIAFRNGSVSEVLDDGVTGYVVDTIEGAVQAVERIPKLNRKKCRGVFEERFAAERMTRDYLAVYRRLLEQPSRHPAVEVAPTAASLVNR
jgi:glycosyltransferase involved in cell wall biosynthesis